MKIRFIGLLVLGLLATSIGSAQTIVQNITYNSGQVVSVSAPTSLTAGPNVVVSAGATVTYQAGSVVTLEPGFTAAVGSNFHAGIGTGNGTYVLTVVGGTGSAYGLTPGTVRTITANSAPSGQFFTGWSITSGTGTIGSPTAGTTTFTMSASNATVRANFDYGADDDHDGVSNDVELALGLNPNDPNDVRVFTYTYDKINQLQSGPGGQYNKDAEGNIKQVRQ